MSLENQVARVSQGAKDTLKALINMMGGNITDELIDQYPAIASQLLPPTGITGNTVTVTAKEQLGAGNMIIILQNGDGYDAYKATTEGVATSNFWLGIAKNTVLADATADVISIAYMEASSDFVVEQNNGNEQKFWVGTDAEYQAIVVKDPNTMYLVTDDCGAVKGYITEAEYAALLATVNGKAEAEHTHTKSQVTDFAHSHEMTDVNGINSALSGKASTTHASTHAANGSDPLTLSIGQVSNLQTSLDTKANAANVYTKTESDTLLQNKAGWSQNNITGSVLDWAKSQTIPTSGYTNMDATDVPYSGYWLVNVLMTNVNSNWKVVLVYGITSPVEVWYRIYNYGNWNTEWRKLLNDSLTPSEIGAYTKTETNALLDSKPDKNNGKYLTALNFAHSDTPDAVRGKIFTSYDASGNGIIGIDTFNATDGSVARLMLRANGVFQKLIGDSNGTFGAPDALAYESQLKYKRMYQCAGLILDGDGCDMQGVGTASVILHYNGVAEINFSVKITQNSNSGVFKWGINPSLLSARNANIPAITPINHLGVCHLFTNSGVYDSSALGYGGLIEVDTGRWRIARVYSADGVFGGYPCDVVPVGYVITGTCYGYF